MEVIDRLLKSRDFPEGSCWTRHIFEANSEIVAQGEPSKTVYYLQAGSARVIGTVMVGDDKQMKPGVYDISPGEVFGELALFDNEPRSASVIALEDSNVILIDGAQLLSYLEANKELGFAMMKAFMGLMVGRLRQTNKKMFSLLAWGLKAHSIDQYLSK